VARSGFSNSLFTCPMFCIMKLCNCEITCSWSFSFSTPWQFFNSASGNITAPNGIKHVIFSFSKFRALLSVRSPCKNSTSILHWPFSLPCIVYPKMISFPPANFVLEQDSSFSLKHSQVLQPLYAVSPTHIETRIPIKITMISTAIISLKLKFRLLPLFVMFNID